MAKLKLKAPFPWFGGKSRVAHWVWRAMGPVDNYVEPFAGSLAVLLGRPDNRWQTGAETVNDADAYLCNFWRAVQANPKAVAKYADWPVNETDLISRHLWLVNTGHERIAQLEADPEYYDAKVAGWWVWGLNAWIGAGWCKGDGCWVMEDGKVCKADRQLPHLGNAGQGVNRQLPHLGAGRGVNRQRPHLGDAGRGVNRKRPHLGSAGQGVNRQLPHLGNAGQGVNRQRPHLGDAGQGVNRKRPHLGNAGQGVNRQRPYLGGGNCNAFDRQSSSLCAYLVQLAARLRRVRVCCGDWARVVTDGALAYGGAVGVFLDPPYLGDVRTNDLYRVDDHTIAHAVREWALAHGNDKRFRIVLAGYEDEHARHMPDSWTVIKYKATRAYANHDSKSANAENRHKERLWLSPHCMRGVRNKTLFDR